MSQGAGNRAARRDPHRPGGSVRERRAAPHRGQAVPPRGARSGSAPRGPQLRQPRGGRRRRRVLIAVLLAALLAGAAWVLLASPVFAAREVTVAGTVELTDDEVRAVAAVPIGTPLLRLDTAAIEARVEDLRRVAGATVGRSLTGTVAVAVTERVPVAVLPAPDGVHLVDATATDFATVPAPPPGLPELRVPRVGPGEPSAVAAVEVLTGLPEPLRAQVAVVAAGSAVDVTLLLVGGREVRWGAADQGGHKAAVLGPLLTQPARVYDVTTPLLPTTS